MPHTIQNNKKTTKRTSSTNFRKQSRGNPHKTQLTIQTEQTQPLEFLDRCNTNYSANEISQRFHRLTIQREQTQPLGFLNSSRRFKL